MKKLPLESSWGPSTRCVWGGEDEPLPHGVTVTPVYHGVTLVGPPSTPSHVELSAEERAAGGIPESLVRYSVGIENAADLVADLRAGLEAAAAHHPQASDAR